ncbi:hypothetical protein K7E17_04580, partial [Ligilactobacillus salivarius]|uniref:hypothetical protein n=1 Tax=Ligilactobacillus salivarius TaxID=1624 RepID=UPI001CBD1B55
CGPSLLFCRKNGENKRRTVMQKNFTLSVLNIIQPNFATEPFIVILVVAIFPLLFKLPISKKI